MKTKTQWKFFDVMDYEKEAAYLSKMHAQGWEFDHVSYPGIYHFVACEPQKVCYQLDFNKDGINNKEEYTQMFADCGWEYLQDFVGYSYFRKPVEGVMEEDDIFCDDASRLDMVKRIFRSKILPLMIIFTCFVLTFGDTILEAIIKEHTFPVVGVILFVLMCALYISIFARFTVKYFTFKRSIK